MAELIRLMTFNPPYMPDMALPRALLSASGIRIARVSGLVLNLRMVTMKCEFSVGMLLMVQNMPVFKTRGVPDGERGASATLVGKMCCVLVTSW